MENREQEILSEIKSMMASIRSQLEMLDAKMAELQQVVDPEGFEANSVNIEIDDLEISGETQTETFEIETQEIPLIVEEPEAVEAEIDDDLPFAESPAEPAAPVEPAVQEAEDEDDDLLGIFDEPETVTIVAKSAAAARPTINDAHSADQAWRRDMPGTPVRDIRSAISLNDRVFFINNLFEEDAQRFVDALVQINTMETLDQVVEFITGQFPHWDLNSETVYRFMMAVRRKVK